MEGIGGAEGEPAPDPTAEPAPGPTAEPMPAPMDDPLICEKHDAEERLNTRWVFDDANRVVELERYGPFHTFGGEVIEPSDTPRTVRTYRYDADDNLVEERTTTEGVLTVKTCTWVGGLQTECITERTPPDGPVSLRATRFEYDDAGRLRVERLFNEDEAIVREVITTYDDDGRRVTRTTDSGPLEDGQRQPIDGAIDQMTTWTYPEPRVAISTETDAAGQIVYRRGRMTTDEADRRIELLLDLDADDHYELRQRWRFENDYLIEASATVFAAGSEEVVEAVEATFTREGDRLIRAENGEFVWRIVCSEPVDFDLVELP